MTKQHKTLQGAAVKFGRLVSTTDQVLAQRLGQIVDIDAITRGRDCDVSATEQGTICFWINYELYEVAPEFAQ